MVIGYHLIFTAYAWWLPNDPRGSTSHHIRSDVIAQLGELHHGRKRIQPTGSTIRAFYDNARKTLKHELREFNGEERTTIACGFAHAIHKRNFTCYACAIMPDHVHILIRKRRDRAEEMIAHLQECSRERLIAQENYPPEHPVWGGPGWKVFLDTANDMERTIRYIAKNPIPYRLPVQQHSFVTIYDGWNLNLAAR